MMETIWDHNPTEEEMQALFAIPITKEEFLRWADEDSCNVLLYRLFMLRDDPKTATRYLSRIRNKQLRRETAYFDIIQGKEDIE